MNKFDFLSRSPHAMIFGINANKTNLGGVFTSVYLLLVLLITIVYLYDFSAKSKYSVIYSYEHQYIHGIDNWNKRHEDKNLNPTITFNVNINNINKENFFLIVTDYNTDPDPNPLSHMHNLGENIETNVYDLVFSLCYFCAGLENNTCIKHEEDIINDWNKYDLIFNYTGTKINHQKEESPLEKENISEIYDIVIDDKILYYELKWKSIKYSEEKGIFGRLGNLFGKTPSEFYGGEFMSPKVIKLDTPQNLAPKYPLPIQTLAIFRVSGINQNHFDIYTRAKKSIFDSISLICSLSLTVYNIMTFLFCGYYSNSFDNYKIIDSILFKNKKIHPIENEEEKEDNNIIELSSDFNKKENLIGINSINYEDNITLSQKGKEKKDENKYSNYGETNEKEKKISHRDTRILPKLHFYDFIFNNIYSKKCCLSKKQEIIDSCNELVSEYFTIDNIIYNQMRLENLFKDYKWNNPGLNTIGNNKLNYLFDNYE